MPPDVNESTLDTDGPLQELEAMATVHKTLKPLTVDARQRVISWAVGALSLSAVQMGKVPPQNMSAEDSRSAPDQNEDSGTGKSAFSTCADLFSAARPKTNAAKALVGGYWLQVCQGSETFTSFSVNNELKNLGEVVGNITSAFDSLKDGKPQLAMQVRKEGRSQQARKKYKLTVAGIAHVERMIRGDGGSE